MVLKDDSTKSSYWKLVVVKKLIPGRNDKIRAAWVKVASDDGTPHLMKKSTQNLKVKSTNLNAITLFDQHPCCLKHGECDIYFIFEIYNNRLGHE